MRSPIWLTANNCLVRSAKDKAILEAAYNANPKPDKAARLDIVKRVSLNEKEVQVRLSQANRQLNYACDEINRTKVLSQTDPMCSPTVDLVSKPSPE